MSPSQLYVKIDEFRLRGIGLTDYYPEIFGDNNPPWKEDESGFTEGWPADTVVVPLSTTGATFWDKIKNTLDALPTGSRVVIQLEIGTYHLTVFKPALNPGDPGYDIMYAFAMWFGPKLAGFKGRGATKTFIQLDANSMSVDQLAGLTVLRARDFAPVQMAFARFDPGPNNEPVLLGGLTFQAADQQMLTSAYWDTFIATPQPAPHQGIVIYRYGDSIVNDCRFLAAGRAAMSAPPYEMANLNSQYGNGKWTRCEFDGRLAASINPKRPLRCGAVMLNNESSSLLTDCWIRYANVSRYAANDQNRDTSGSYMVLRTQVDHISYNMNTDPDLNNGKSLGGYNNAACMGWESVNGIVTVQNSQIRVNNPNPVSGWGEIPTHFQLTSVGNRNPIGGRFNALDNSYLYPVYPQLNGFCTMRIAPNTHWYTDGLTNTVNVTQNGVRLLPYEVGGGVQWPPTIPNNITPQTHYLARIE